MPEIINWELAKNPLNWVIAFLMVFIAGVVVHLLLSHVQLSSATGGSLNAAANRAANPTQPRTT